MLNAATGCGKPLSASSPTGSNSTRLSTLASALRSVRICAAPGLAAEPRGEVRDTADRAIVPAPFETDRADGGVALRDADADPELEALPAPAFRERREAVPHLQRHLHGVPRQDSPEARGR